ncbi:MAG: TlyA family rRNA (cytidine-2'-O)-methyltransferase [Candidatus Melainabacteria bacterium HGW-Melainabacteria-1]|nr:MAG: TlyA family rRNA (cytidine-2'-O)-methyltransferase [Candidatus Melainabacteria bacterium HGW-Melainabacteria-1]
MPERLDILLVNAGFFPTREKARGAIMAGLVRQGPKVLDKPGHKFAELPANLAVLGNSCPYVSRGGLKLAKALEVFEIAPKDRICLDIGASTGGFTDCLLQQGAERVYAIDVGYGQIDWKLRTDPRVTVLEKTNARYLSPADLYGEAPKASLAVMDVSFISILKIFPALLELLAADGLILSLIKPQFEAPPSDNRKGIVSDPKAHLRVLTRIQAESPASGWHLHQVTRSPIQGKSGNTEFLGVFYRQPPAQSPALAAALQPENESPEQQIETAKP